jgi:hypothetical protein
VSRGPGEETFADAVEDGRVADDAAGGHIGGAGFELGLEEGDDGRGWGHAGRDRGENLFEGDEREVGDDKVDGRERGEVAGVDAFEQGDAGVFAESLMELAAADVDGDDTGGAVLEEAVGKAAGGGAEVETGEAGGVDGEGAEGGFELEPATADVGERLSELEWGIGVEGLGGFDEQAGSAADLPGHDELAGTFARFGEATLDEEEVGADTGHGMRLHRARRARWMLVPVELPAQKFERGGGKGHG